MGLDLNGKRFTWQAVVLLPFIDEPRLVRILGPLLKQLKPSEKVRNRRGNELVFGHKDDKNLFHAVQLAQAAFEAGHAGKKQHMKENWFSASLEGWQSGGAGRTVNSPIEGLPDVEESHAMSAQYTDPEGGRHESKMLAGAAEQPLCVNAADLDEQTRMKGFGGEQARRMIMQALGKDPNQKPRYKEQSQPAQQGGWAPRPQHAPPAAQAAAFTPQEDPYGGQMLAPEPAPSMEFAAEDPYGATSDPYAVPGAPALAPSFQPTPPPGTKVIRIKGKNRAT